MPRTKLRSRILRKRLSRDKRQELRQRLQKQR